MDEKSLEKLDNEPHVKVKKCVLIDKSTREANYNAPIVREIDNPENAIFEITDTKLYVPVVTLSEENDIKL